MNLSRDECITCGLIRYDFHPYHNFPLILIRNPDPVRQILTDVHRLLHASGLSVRIQRLRRNIQIQYRPDIRLFPCDRHRLRSIGNSRQSIAFRRRLAYVKADPHFLCIQGRHRHLERLIFLRVFQISVIHLVSISIDQFQRAGAHRRSCDPGDIDFGNHFPDFIHGRFRTGDLHHRLFRSQRTYFQSVAGFVGISGRHFKLLCHRLFDADQHIGTALVDALDGIFRTCVSSHIAHRNAHHAVIPQILLHICRRPEI